MLLCGRSQQDTVQKPGEGLLCPFLTLLCIIKSTEFKEFGDWLTFNTHKKGAKLGEDLVNMPYISNIL